MNNKEEKYYHIYSVPASEFFYDVYDAVDKEGWSVRHVKVEKDKTLGFANRIIQTGKTFLPEASIYPLDQIKKLDLKWKK